MNPRTLLALIARGGVGQARLERALRLSPGYLTKIKSGRRAPSAPLLGVLNMIALDTKPRLVVEGIEEKQRTARLRQRVQEDRQPAPGSAVHQAEPPRGPSPSAQDPGPGQAPPRQGPRGRDGRQP